MAKPNPNKQSVELNRTSLYWGLLNLLSSRLTLKQAKLVQFFFIFF